MIIIPEIIDITQEEYEMMMKIQKELNLTQQDFINKALKEAIEKYEIIEYTYYCDHCGKNFEQDIGWCSECGGHLESQEKRN